jgi:hypothetical protein
MTKLAAHLGSPGPSASSSHTPVVGGSSDGAGRGLHDRGEVAHQAHRSHLAMITIPASQSTTPPRRVASQAPATTLSSHVNSYDICSLRDANWMVATRFRWIPRRHAGLEARVYHDPRMPRLRIKAWSYIIGYLTLFT